MAGTLSSIFVRLGFKVDAEAIDRIQTRLESFKQNLTNMGPKLQQVGAAMSTAVTLPVLGAAYAIGKIAGDFDAQMRVVQAVSGATGAELDAMREKAISLGSSTQYSAAEAAAGMIEFSKAGLSAGQVMDAIGPALNFAAASGLELGRVAEITAISMSQFGLAATDATFISDVFTKAADASTTGVEELSQAMAEAAPFARLVGADIAETTTLIAAMANAGIQGSKAGTAMKNGFVSLSAPTKQAREALSSVGIAVSDFQDSSGKMKIPFTTLLKQLSKTGLSIEQGVAIFGRESAGAMLSVINDFTKVEKVADAMAGLQGNAALQASIKMKGFNGSLKGLKSALDTLAIRLADAGVLDFMEKIVVFATRLVKTLSNLNPSVLKFGAIIVGAAAVVGPLIGALGLLSVAFAGVTVASLKAWFAMFAPVAAVVAGVGFALLAIALLVDDLLAYLEGRPSLLGKMIEYVKNDFPVLARIISAIGPMFAEGIEKGVLAGVKSLMWLEEKVVGLINKVREFLGLEGQVEIEGPQRPLTPEERVDIEGRMRKGEWKDYPVPSGYVPIGTPSLVGQPIDDKELRRKKPKLDFGKPEHLAPKARAQNTLDYSGNFFSATDEKKVDALRGPFNMTAPTLNVPALPPLKVPTLNVPALPPLKAPALPAPVAKGIGAVGSPKVTSGLAAGLTDARQTTRNVNTSNQAQTINAPININVTTAPGTPVDAKDIKREVTRGLNDVLQGSAQGATPVFSQ